MYFKAITDGFLSQRRSVVAAYIRPQQCDGCCIQKLPYDCASDTKATEQLSNCCSSNNRRSKRSSSSSCFNWKLLRGQVKAHQQQLLPVLQLHQQQSHTDTHKHKHLHRHSEKSIVKCSSYVAVVAFNLLARCWQLHHAKATLTTMMKAAAVAAATGLALDLASASAFLGYFLKLTASA